MGDTRVSRAGARVYSGPNALNLADVHDTELGLVLEARGPERVQSLLKAIGAKGYEARWLAFE